MPPERFKATVPEKSPFCFSESRRDASQEFGQILTVCGWSLTVPGVSGVTGSALHETSFINRSLAALADVLGALSERRGHIPYRNSKLAHMLQDALGKECPLEELTAVPCSCGEQAPPGHTSCGDLLALESVVCPQHP